MRAVDQLAETSSVGHVPVLLSEVLSGLAVQPDGIYVDATFGRGGHSRAILARLGPAGRLLAMDKDPEAELAMQAEKDGPWDARFSLQRGCFSTLSDALTERGWQGSVAGILLDLGVSSPQLDTAARGFSFQHDGPLDMRMDPTIGESAADWLAGIDTVALSDVIRINGEERHAWRIAKAIVRARALGPILRTGQLADIVAGAVPYDKRRRVHPATRTFQAIRMEINGELSALRAVLPQCVAALRVGGRLVVMSFHSLEDRPVKHFIRQCCRGEEIASLLPGPPRYLRPPQLKRVGPVVKASAADCALNPRARSVRLRVAEKIAPLD